MTQEQWLTAKRNLAAKEADIRYRLKGMACGVIPDNSGTLKLELAELQATRERLRRSIGRRGYSFRAPAVRDPG